MKRVFPITLVLTSLVLVGACSRNAASDSGSAPVGPVAAAIPATALDPSVAEALTAGRPELPVAAAASAGQAAAPQNAVKIVVPPRPKPGAPHGPGFDMPLIDVGGFAPPRPPDVLRDAHVFAADHPEVSSYIPCYCGCGKSMAHKDNADCFVAKRDALGRVTEWVPHGSACAVCIDIAVQSMRMFNSGASVAAIRSTIEREYRPQFPGTETLTPRPPAGK